MERISAFPIKSYGRKELAQIYLPDNEGDYAQKKLMVWIRRYPGLSAALIAKGFDFKQRIFTPVQVKLIVEAIGAPLDYAKEP